MIYFFPSLSSNGVQDEATQLVDGKIIYRFEDILLGFTPMFNDEIHWNPLFYLFVSCFFNPLILPSGPKHPGQSSPRRCFETYTRAIRRRGDNTAPCQLSFRVNFGLISGSVQSCGIILKWYLTWLQHLKLPEGSTSNNEIMAIGIPPTSIHCDVSEFPLRKAPVKCLDAECEWYLKYVNCDCKHL